MIILCGLEVRKTEEGGGGKEQEGPRHRSSLSSAALLLFFSAQAQLSFPTLIYLDNESPGMLVTEGGEYSGIAQNSTKSHSGKKKGTSLKVNYSKNIQDIKQNRSHFNCPSSNYTVTLPIANSR